MSIMRSRCERVWASKRDGGSGFSMVYQRPLRASDLKREGRTLEIWKGSRKMVLDGVQLRSLKSILHDVGEIRVLKNPKPINSRRCRICAEHPAGA